VLRSGHQRAAANSSCDRLDLGCREARASACSPGGLRAWSGRPSRHGWDAIVPLDGRTLTLASVQVCRGSWVVDTKDGEKNGQA
jgi:hypothetical protein